MKEKVLAGVLAIVIAVFVVGTFYAFIKGILAIVGLFTVLSWVISLWSKSKEPKAPEALGMADTLSSIDRLRRQGGAIYRNKTR